MILKYVDLLQKKNHWLFSIAVLCIHLISFFGHCLKMVPLLVSFWCCVGENHKSAVTSCSQADLEVFYSQDVLHYAH